MRFAKFVFAAIALAAVAVAAPLAGSASDPPPARPICRSPTQRVLLCR